MTARYGKLATSYVQDGWQRPHVRFIEKAAADATIEPRLFRRLSREDLRSEIIPQMVSKTCFALCALKLAEGFAEAGCLRKLLRKLRSASDAYLIPA